MDVSSHHNFTRNKRRLGALKKPEKKGERPNKKGEENLFVSFA